MAVRERYATGCPPAVQPPPFKNPGSATATRWKINYPVIHDAVMQDYGKYTREQLSKL